MRKPESPWFALLTAVLALSAGGCLTRPILPENEPMTLSADAPSSATEFCAKVKAVAEMTPATVRHLDRKPHYLSLAEAIALALEKGYTGFPSSRSPGVANDELAAFNGSEAGSSDSIRVLALQPAIAGTNIDISLARFDPQAFTNATWRSQDDPDQGLNAFTNGSSANLAFGIAKPLSTGGIAGVSWNTDYNYLTAAPPSVVLNPSYFTRIEFGFEQPLLKGNGVFINQIFSDLPASSLFPTLNSRFGNGQGILISRVRAEQQRAEFERRVNHLLLNVEVAYWNLYAAYVDLYTTDQALRMATEVWRVAKEQFPEKIDEGDFAGTRSQLQFFRGNRLQNIGRILDAERNLRLLIGLEVEDGDRLVPIDAPNSTAYEPDWSSSVQEAMLRRPELILVRQEIKRKQYQVDNRMNLLQPDLRFVATYDIVGLGSRLDGNSEYVDSTGITHTNNAIRGLFENRNQDWTLGLRASVPLGYRAEFAAIRQAKLELAQSTYLLQEQETKARSFLAKQYSRLFELTDVIEARRQERLALADQVEVRFRKFAAGKTPVDFLQDSVRQWASALSAEYRAVADYNTAIATFHFAKGTLMEYDNVNIMEGNCPVIQPVRAAEAEQVRTEEMAERQNRRIVPPRSSTQAPPLLPELPPRAASPVPQLLATETPLPAPPEEMLSAPALRLSVK
jgi:outer membrane protein TolC